MIDIDALITDLKNDSNMSDWSIQRAWSMAPVDDENLRGEVPILAFYRGNEVFSKRVGSPCGQSSKSPLIAMMVLDDDDEQTRIKQARQAILGWQKAGDRSCLALYISDESGMPCGPVQITGRYIWQKDVWFTNYDLIKED